MFVFVLGPYSYQWDDANNQSTQTAIGLPMGSYNVTVTDANGCDVSSSVVIEQKIQIGFVVDNIPCSSCSDGEITGTVNGFGTPPFTYRWNDVNEQTTLTATGLTTGTYVLLVTDANGCYNSDTITIGITGMDETKGLMEQFKLFPNPNKGSFKLIIPDGENAFVNIWDASGRKVLHRSMNNNSTIEMTGFRPGVYFIQLKINDYFLTKRVMVSG